MSDWRLIDSGACGAAYNMALDEAIALLVLEGDSPPTLRLYAWDRPSISLGCFQSITDVDLEYCTSNGIPLVRRPTGGRAVLHDNELTYSFSVKRDTPPFSEGLLESYRVVSSAFCSALKNMGVSAEPKRERERGRNLTKSPLCFGSSSYGEILLDDRKVIGSAQKRWSNGLLQQGSIPYVVNEGAVSAVFGEERARSGKERTIGLREVLPQLDADKFKGEIALAFEGTFGIRFAPSHPSREEALLARELVVRKYRSPHWNSQRQVPEGLLRNSNSKRLLR